MNATGPGQADVTVSVAMITYNHEAFIAQAIEGVLMQQTDFTFELIVGEDCSTDGTRPVVQAYGERYPERIRLLLPENNRGADANFNATWNACCGNYVALCEGDDCWTDPLKLQKQVEFLEAHRECSICFHDVMVVYEDQQRLSHRFCAPDQKEISTLEDLLVRNFISTPSVMYRHGSIGAFPDWYHKLAVGDWPLHLLNAQHGCIGFINEVMAVYRVHAGGNWSGREAPTKFRQLLPMYGHFYNHLDEAHRPAVRLAASKAIADGAAAIYNAGEADGLAPSLDYVRTALDSAASAGYADASFVRVTWARSYEALGFTAYRKRDMRLTRYCFVRALAFEPALAKNRGILALWFEACFGERASTIRKNLRLRSLRE